MRKEISKKKQNASVHSLSALQWEAADKNTAKTWQSRAIQAETVNSQQQVTAFEKSNWQEDKKHIEEIRLYDIQAIDSDQHNSDTVIKFLRSRTAAANHSHSCDHHILWDWRRLYLSSSSVETDHQVHQSWDMITFTVRINATASHSTDSDREETENLLHLSEK